MAKTTKDKKTTPAPKKAQGKATRGNGKSGGGQGQTQNQIPTMPIQVQGQFIRDLSFEVPDVASHTETQKNSPTINLNVEVRAQPVSGKNRYEVDLQITAEATRKNDRAFLLELIYAGIFEIKGLPEESLPPALLVECPRLLFPFARNVVATVTREGGFPPLALAPIDFVEIYRRQLSQLREQQAQGGKGKQSTA